jgi:acetoin utilization protein AcuB
MLAQKNNRIMANQVSEIMNQPVSSIMSTKLKTVIPTDGLDKVQEIFDNYNIHHIPVVRYTELVGMISKTDFNKAIHGARVHNPEAAAAENTELFSNAKVEDLMTPKIAKISPEDKIGVAAEIFLENYFHAVPVVDEGGELKGMVTTYDVIKVLFKAAYPTQELKNIVE